MQRSQRALILDDHVPTLNLLVHQLEEAFPDLVIETRTTPDPRGQFDLFLIDNNFGGRACAEALVRQIRAVHPTALVVAFSSTLNRRVLKALLNAGCSGVCDKSAPEDLASLTRMARVYLEELRASGRGRGGGVVRAARAIRQLLEAWNRRFDLEALGHASAEAVR